ncbi:hypothetical protein Aduo_019885 [Ancylostoma duodenale]
MKTYVVLPVLHLASAFLPNYLDPGNRFQAIRTQYDPRQRLMGQLQRSEVSVEDSLDAGKVQSYLQAPIMDHDSDGERCEALPNGTSNKPAFFMCKEDTLVTLHGGAITNMNGDDRYPVNFEKPIRVFLDVTSVAPRRYDNLGLEVSLYKRSTGWFGCGWMFLPSFGMLSNYEMCADNPSCPLSPGRQVLEFTIDTTRLFTRLFRMIHYDMSAYQLVVRLRDNRDPFNELLCATIQTRVHL